MCILQIVNYISITDMTFLHYEHDVRKYRTHTLQYSTLLYKTPEIGMNIKPRLK